tara:strand:- start:15 stop:671 length:657 start_codon:yes stop_codon:yes gene_type:complete
MGAHRAQDAVHVVVAIVARVSRLARLASRTRVGSTSRHRETRDDEDASIDRDRIESNRIESIPIHSIPPAMDDGDGDARASSSSPSAAGTFSVLARRVDGADVGPVTIEASDGTVRALKRALYDAPWRPRARGTGTTEEEAGAKPAGPGNLRVLANGRVAAPDSKSLRELGMAADGKTRVVHVVVSARRSRSETRAPEYGGEKGDASRGRSPQCCSVM